MLISEPQECLIPFLNAKRNFCIIILRDMTHRITKNWKDKVKSAVPFGIGQTKPKHFRNMLQIVWANRDNLGYAWKVITRGVCDGCALGVAGLHDWTIKG